MRRKISSKVKFSMSHMNFQIGHDPYTTSRGSIVRTKTQFLSFSPRFNFVSTSFQPRFNLVSTLHTREPPSGAFPAARGFRFDTSLSASRCARAGVGGKPVGARRTRATPRHATPRLASPRLASMAANVTGRKRPLRSVREAVDHARRGIVREFRRGQGLSNA